LVRADGVRRHGQGSSPSDQLFQAGTEQDYLWETTRFGPTAYTNYQGWFDVVNTKNEATYTSVMSVSPGDLVYVVAQYVFSLGKALFVVYDETTNQYSSTYVAAGGFGGYHAEWVAERTAHASLGQAIHYSRLADFHLATLTGAEAETGGVWAGVGQRSHTYGSMNDPYNDDAEQRDAYPGGISSSGQSFTFYWTAQGDIDGLNS
jgi:hypothetical protein